ncbi:MAG TPA: hypothetical protein VFS60_19455 [Thermoanaerobaculia bacterium]|nr:hypothetical protein [Thermoanaerobaculia bacterium]
MVDLRYSIGDYRPDADYFLAPLFKHVDGSKTFNELARFSDAVQLREPVGQLHYEYAIAREWDSGKLGKPIALLYYVLERTAAHEASRIGASEELRFSDAP